MFWRTEDDPQRNSNTYLRGGGDGLTEQPIRPPRPTRHTSHIARATQQNARDNHTHLGGRGRQAAKQPIRPSLAITAHLRWVCARSVKAKKRAQRNSLTYLRGGGRPVNIWTASDPPWPSWHTPCHLSRRQSKETHDTHLRGGGRPVNTWAGPTLPGHHGTPLQLKNDVVQTKVSPRNQKCHPETENVAQMLEMSPRYVAKI